MIFFLPFIAEHTWLAPIAHFLSSAIIGTVAYYIGMFLFKNGDASIFSDGDAHGVYKRTRLAFAIFVGIATHIFFDLLGWF